MGHDLININQKSVFLQRGNIIMAILRVSGNLGAGKTTICERLAEALGYENHYTGQVFRDLAKEKGLSIEVFYKQMVANPELEKDIDNHQARLMLTKDNIIVQGRIAPFLPWKPGCKKIDIFFKVSDEEGARRQLERKENKGKSLEEMTKLSQERVNEERQRYSMLYPNIPDYLNEKLFDIVIDTTHLNPDRVFEKLIGKIRSLI